MKQLLQRLTKYLAYFAAAVVILLAVAVGLFRLMLPRLPEYQEEIKAWANAAIGMQVEFTGMNARWRLSGPEVNFYNAELVRPDGSDSLLSVEELTVGVGLMRLLVDRELVVDRVLISDTSLDVRQADDGAWLVQGVPLEDLIGSGKELPEGGGAAVTVIGLNINLDYWPQGAQEPLELVIDNLQVQRDDTQLDIEVTVDLPDELGERIDASANQRQSDTAEKGVWQFFVEGKSLVLAGWMHFQPPEFPVVNSGQADLRLWLELSKDGIRSANGDVIVTDLAAGDAVENVPFDVQGRFEFSHDSGGWLLAADNFRLQRTVGEWPNSSIRADMTSDKSGRILAVDARASFINLDNLKLLRPWLTEKQRSMLDAFGPSGMVHGFELGLPDLGSESYRFDLAAELEEVGIKPREKWPGLSGFSGQIRADRSGGRIEIQSRDLRLDMPAFLLEPITFDDAIGTVIWRRNNDATIILSDSVRIRNADLDARSSLQVSLPANGGSPLIDFVSNWNITDVSAVSRYLPGKLMRPTMYQWFDTALVGGRVPRGTTRFTGPLDKFPFEGEEGIFRVDAHVEDAKLKYHPLWPLVEQISADFGVDNMRLYSDHNIATTLGNISVDARVEIADMREPVLTIDANAAGTLETIRQLSRQSPIADVFGGQLDRIQVDGDATFDLQLRYPIREKLNYTFTTSILPNNGQLSIEGFKPPITELNGLVTVTRDTIESESLTAQFLGELIDIDLVHAAGDMPEIAAIASATGTATADGLIEGLGLPLAGLLEGSTPYNAKILFPRSKVEEPVPLHIAVETDLDGFVVKLPMPAGKAADETRALSLHIEFPEPDRIDSFGSSDEDIKWSVTFRKEEERWDFDRGMVAVGGVEATEPETRGLHIVGETPELHLRDWLETAPDETHGPGAGERIRSIDLIVDDLYVLGQHLSRHMIKVDRGAEEWLVELDGNEVVGSLVVPYDFSSDKPLLVDMEKLILPGRDDDEADAADPIDPRALPPISIKANEFALGKRYFGSFEAEFASTDTGLESVSMTTSDDSFQLSGAGRWVVEAEEDQTAQRSYLKARITSTDVEASSRRLNYQPGIVSKDLEVEFDVSWPGGPREDLLADLNGNILVRLGEGQLDDVEPGAGRVFGLMSVVALPRRLSLDFRDVFGKGFGFDEITGSFRIENGESFTCNLTLKGPAADIGIIGQAGLAARDYHQTAMVNASVSDTLPIVGALAAGPQVAAALLIFSQIFKKPLQGMGQIYYSIEGSWDDPTIETVDAEQFAKTYEAAGCPTVAE